MYIDKNIQVCIRTNTINSKETVIYNSINFDDIEEYKKNKCKLRKTEANWCLFYEKMDYSNVGDFKEWIEKITDKEYIEEQKCFKL